MKKVCLFLAALCVLAACKGKEVAPAQDTPEQQQEDAILKVHTLGAYQVDGKDYTYKRGEWQLSRQYSTDGRTVTFSMLDPENTSVYSFSGIKTAAEKGQSIYMTFSVQEGTAAVVTKSSSAKVIGISGDTLWLKSSVGPYYIVKK